MIYVVVNEELTYMKIGYTTNMKNRLRMLQSGNPSLLSVARLMDGTVDDERGIHKALDHTRVLGEWFYYSAENINNLHLLFISSVKELPKEATPTQGSAYFSLVRMALKQHKIKPSLNKLVYEDALTELFNEDEVKVIRRIRKTGAWLEKLQIQVDAYNTGNKHLMFEAKQVVKTYPRKYRKLFKEQIL